MNMNSCNEVEQKHKVFVPNGSMSMDTTPSSVTLSTVSSTTPMLTEPTQNGVALPNMITSLGGNMESNQLGSLMEKLRAKTVGVGKTWSDLAKIIRNSSIDKRLAMDMSEKCQLQKCLDSIQKSIKVTSLQSMVERLESITRQQGLKFTAGPSGMDCFISSDMFYVEVLLDNTGEVKDVKIAHHGDPVSCPELTKVLSSSDFTEFNSHLEGLAEIYQLNADKKQKTKAFLALQALETDLSMLAQFQCSINDPNNVVHKSPVGILQPRKGGHAMKLTYFISPYDLIDANNKTCIPLSVEIVMEKKLGHSVTVSIESSTAHKLQTTSLIIVKTQDGKSLPTFAAHTNLNSTTLPANFVLRLKKPIAMATGMVKSIKAVTNIEFVDTSASVPLLSLIVQEQFKQQNTSNSFSANKNNQGSKITTTGNRSIEDGLSVVLPDQLHCYHFSGWEDLKGVLVESISFTHPTAVPQILVFLRQQTLFNTLLASCVRPPASTSNSPRTKMFNSSNNGLMTASNDQSIGSCAEDPLKFEVQTLSMSHIVVSFEHPLEESLATVDLDLKDITNVKCKIYTLGTDSVLCTDEYASKVIQRCLSIPVTMRALIRKGQAQKNQQHSRMNGSGDQFFSPESSGGPNIIPNGRPPGSSGMSGGGGPNENGAPGISYLSSHLPGYGRNRSGLDNSDRPKDDSLEDDIEMDELEDDELDDESSGKEEEHDEGSCSSRSAGLSGLSQLQQCRDTEHSSVSSSAAENNPILDSLLSPQFQGPGKANTMLMSMLRDVPAANTLPANNFPFLANKNAASKAASNKTTSVPPSPTNISTNVPVASRSSSLDSVVGPSSSTANVATKKQKKKKEHKEKVLSSQFTKPKKSSSSSGFNLSSELKSGGSLESRLAKPTSELPSVESKTSKSLSSTDFHTALNKSSSAENLSLEPKTPNLSMEFNWPDIEPSQGRKLSQSGQSSNQQCKRVSKRNRSESAETNRMTESEESCSEEISQMTTSLSNEAEPACFQVPDANRKSSPLVKSESPRASPHAGLASPTSSGASRNQGILKISKTQDTPSKSDSSKTKSSKSVDQAAFLSNTSSKKKDGKREKKRRRVDTTNSTSLGTGANCGVEDKQVKPLHINLSLDSSLMPPPPLGGEARTPTCSSPTDSMIKPLSLKTPNSNKKNQINEIITSTVTSKGQNKTSSGSNVKYKSSSSKTGGGGSSSPSSVKLKHLNLGLPASTTITPVLPSPIKGNHVSPPTTPSLSSPTTGTSISIIPSHSPPCDNLISGSAMMSNAQSVKNTARASRKNSLKDVIDKLRGNPVPPAPVVSPVTSSHHAHHLATSLTSSTPTNLTTGGANRPDRKDSVVSSSSSMVTTKSGESKSKYSSSDQFTIKQSSGIKLTVTKTRPTTLSETKLQSSKTKTSSANVSSQKQGTTNAQYPATKKSSQEGKSQSSKTSSEGKSKQISQVIKNNRSSPNSSINKSLSNSSNKVKPLQQLHSLAAPKFPLTNQNILSSLNPSGIPEMGALDLVSALSNESKNSSFQHLLHPPISNSDAFADKPTVTNTSLTMMPELDLSKTDFSKQGLFGKPVIEKDAYPSSMGASDNEMVPTNLSRMATTEKVSSSSDNVSKNNSEFEAIQMELRRSATPQTLDLSDNKETASSSSSVPVTVTSAEEPSSSFKPVLNMDQMASLILQGQEKMANAIQHKEKLDKISIINSTTLEKHSKQPEKLVAHNLCMKSIEDKDDLDKSPEEGLVIDYNPGESAFSSSNNPNIAPSCQTTPPVGTTTAASSSQLEKAPQSEANVASPATTTCSKSPFPITPVTTKSPAPVGTPPSNHSISSSMSRPSPCVIDDDLMDEAVMGLGD